MRYAHSAAGMVQYQDFAAMVDLTAAIVEELDEAKLAAFQRILLPFERFAFDAVSCVHHYGRIRDVLGKSGKTLGPLDLLIAAHALALGAKLVTHNTREFRRVPDLQIEDWA